MSEFILPSQNNELLIYKYAVTIFYSKAYEETKSKT